MKLKSDEKFEEKLNCGLEDDMRNMANFHQSTWVSKLGFWWDPLIQNRKSMCLKFIEELCIMTMKNDAKFEKELTCRFKIVSWQIWEILTQALESLKNFHFNAILLSKIYIVWDKKVQRSYLLWHWKGIQNLERNRLVLSNLT